MPTFPYSHLITASSPPLNVMAINESVGKIRLTWRQPTAPNGIIVAYRVSQMYCVSYVWAYSGP